MYSWGSSGIWTRDLSHPKRESYLDQRAVLYLLISRLKKSFNIEITNVMQKHIIIHKTD